MTIPMDISSDNSSRERVQRLYDKNAELETRCRKAAQARIPSDPNTWQQMRENYGNIIIEDHAFSEQHEIEYALWQLHYRRIEELRAHYSAALSSSSQNGKGTTRTWPDRVAKIRSQFKNFLSEATGFYHDLMVKIRAKYGLPLGYDPENHIAFSKNGNEFAEVKKGLVSCNRCLIYLGDLARYKGLYGEGDSKARDFATASSYYMQASSLWPSNGNPHHQLAILASYSGDDLAAVYQYFRSLAVQSPFSTARENLIIVFEKNRQSYSQLLGDMKAASFKSKQVRTNGRGRGRGKLEGKPPRKDSKVDASPVKEKSRSIPETLKTFSIRFLRLNGILFTRTSLETFEEVFSLTRSDFVDLLTSGPDEELNFGSDASNCRLLIIRLIAILIFTVHNANRETENQSYAEILQRSVVLQNAFTAIFEFMGHILARCIQLNDASESYLLPGIMIFVEWLACCQDIAVGNEVEERQARARSFFWKHCISFLNKLLLSGFIIVNQDEDDTCFNNMSRYDEGETANRFALSEDFELRGFLPLLPAQLILDFSRKHFLESDSVGKYKLKKARIERIVAAGKALANVVKVGVQGIYYDTKLKRFAIGVEPPETFDDYAEIPTPNHVGPDKSVKSEITAPTVVQPMVQLHVDEEDEDEVIVFKPSITKINNTERIGRKLTFSEVPLPSVDASIVNFENVGTSVSASYDGSILQNSFNTSSRAPTSIANITAQYLHQPIQPSRLNWSIEQRDSVANGFANLNLVENGFSTKPELQNYAGVSQPAASTVPLPESIGLGAVDRYPVQATETVIPSRLDFVMSSSGANTNTLSMKLPPATSAGLKKNPVSRPIRHLGPPPGFNSVPAKLVDESLFSGITTMKETPTPIDDYSWLDGYQVPSSINQSVQSYQPVSMSNNSNGAVSFPYPGKQVSTPQAQIGYQNGGWQDYQLYENLKQYQKQQQHVEKVNQYSGAQAQHYQGQSLWDGRFFV